MQALSISEVGHCIVDSLPPALAIMQKIRGSRPTLSYSKLSSVDSLTGRSLGALGNATDLYDAEAKNASGYVYAHYLSYCRHGRGHFGTCRRYKSVLSRQHLGPSRDGSVQPS